jgi:hypothetical protein
MPRRGVVARCVPRHGPEPDAGRELHEVKPGDILKKAHSNMIQRGVTELTGCAG